MCEPLEGARTRLLYSFSSFFERFHMVSRFFSKRFVLLFIFSISFFNYSFSMEPAVRVVSKQLFPKVFVFCALQGIPHAVDRLLGVCSMLKQRDDRNRALECVDYGFSKEYFSREIKDGVQKDSVDAFLEIVSAYGCYQIKNADINIHMLMAVIRGDLNTLDLLVSRYPGALHESLGVLDITPATIAKVCADDSFPDKDGESFD